MAHNRDIIGMVLSSLPAEDQVTAFEHLKHTMSEEQLIEIAGDEATPREVLQQLAGHKKASVRRAVARNAAAGCEVYETLARDTAKTVSAQAHRSLLRVALTTDGAAAPPWSMETFKQVCDIVADAQLSSWESPAFRSLTQMCKVLMSDTAWRGESSFMRWYYEEGLALDDDIIEEVGADSVAEALLAALPVGERERAVEYLSDVLDTGALLKAIQDNQKVLEEAVKKELGPGWKTQQLSVYDRHRPTGWIRVGFSNCPDSVLLEALESEEELLIQVAAANACTRDGLRTAVVKAVVTEWENESYALWDLAEALDDDGLLDLPLAMTTDWSFKRAPEELRDRFHTLFASKVRDIAHEDPQAWRTLAVLAEHHEGSARDLLVALKEL